MLQLVPLAAVVLLNLIVIVYVWRERGRTQSGFFLGINALALIGWAVVVRGAEAQRSVEALRLAAALTATIPANLLLFAIPRRKSPAPGRRAAAMAALFAPPLIACLLHDFADSLPLTDERPYFHAAWAAFWRVEGGMPLAINATYLAMAIGVLSFRYNTAAPGPERNLPRHLILAVAGPLLFGLLFSVLSAASSRVTIIPSPAIVLAITAQLSILAVIRQEDVLRPLYLSRWIYYSITVLIGFSLGIMVYTIYESIAGRVLLTPTVNLTIAISMIMVLAAGSLPPVQRLFDRVMFSRAWEYRQLVREAQRELFETRLRLRQAERLSVVGEMAARIAHEIKNPLGPIRGYTQMMLEKLDEMEDFPQRVSFQRKLAIIAEEVDNIDTRVRHLLDLARKPAVKMQPEDPNKMVNRAAVLLRLEAETLQGDRGVREEGVVVREDLDPDLPEIACSRALVEEALFNLCRNAFEALGGRGTILLRTRRRDSPKGESGVEIVVEDDGPGISEAALKHLYEPFYTEKAGGTGLGLSIVRSHIETHRGTVRFDRGAKRGTTVVVWLPETPQVDQTESGTVLLAPVGDAEAKEPDKRRA